MAFKLSAILNPQSDPSSPAPERHDPPSQVASTYEAANTLTALASGVPSYGSTYAYGESTPATYQARQPPSDHYGADGRPGSSYGAHATPLEPTPPLERSSSFASAGLQQYHHGSRSPEQERRESFSHPQADYANQLPPIHSAGHEDNTSYTAMGRRDAPYGHDVSQMATGNGDTEVNHVAHNREPDYIRDEPAPSQIRRPSPTPPSMMREHAPPAEHSPFAAQIKEEPATTPRPETPQQSIDPNVDVETAMAIAAAANEHGTRVRGKVTTEPSMEPEPAPTKKKPPAAKVGTKKGVARKPAPRKRKLDSEDGRSISPAARLSKSGATHRAGGKKSDSNTPQIGSSPATAADDMSPGPEDDEVAEGSDEEVYCICRRPDNHSWMIACDGGCDDWFHGKCVKMREEQGELIDKYICPNCERAGKGVTTWKPGCRRPGCNKPALITKSKQSKYCSDECGKMFFEEKLGLDEQRPSKKQKRKVDNDSTAAGGDVDDEDDIGPLGGALRAGDVKALVTASADANQFRQLGDGVLSPPATASPERATSDGVPPTTNGDPPHAKSALDSAPPAQPPSYTLTPSEHNRIMDIADSQSRLTTRKVLLRDRERFVKMVVEQATRYAEQQGIKPKDVCGYDSRLAWSDVSFRRWGEGEVGREALRQGSLVANGAAATPLTNGATDEDTGDAATKEPAVNGASAEQNPSFCARKRCEQHRQWQKNELTIVRAELVDVREEEERLAKEEREVRDRAYRRWKGENGGAKLGGEGGSVEDMRADGWVEVL